MLIATARCYDGVSAKTDADSDAVSAMQIIVSDVREAKSVTISTDMKTLTVVFPMTTSEGYYDRYQADVDHPVNYYLSNSAGVQGSVGTYLWRAKNGAKRMLKKNVDTVIFESDTTRSIKITIITKNVVATGPQETKLTHRVVYMRNY